MANVSFGNANWGTQIGINNGSVYLPKEEPRPEPLSTVPFPHDPDFISRDALLDLIHEKASIPGSRTVLFGLGGVGKTQLVIEYCHWLRRQSPKTWVLWIHASNAARCEKSLRDLTERAKIPGRQDRNVNIFQLVGNWLQDERIGKWTLILNNIDDDELLRQPLATYMESQINTKSNASTQPPLRYLFKSSNGSIIVTSRNKGVALDIASQKNLIEVPPMNEAKALDLLQKKLSIPAEHENMAQLAKALPAEHENMVQLAKALEFMPLAIVQAAGYITHRSPRCSISQYLRKFQKSDREAVRLLDHEASLYYRDWEAKNSILLTWQISFDYIRRLKPSATDLLSLMSFFDRQGIPESVLRVQQKQERHRNFDSDEVEQDTDNKSNSDTEPNFKDDITILSDFSLISVRETFTMHRLVQLTVRI